MTEGSNPRSKGADWELTFPALFDSVDAAAAESQKTLLNLRKIEFSALVLGAAASEIPGDVLFSLGPIVTVVLFSLALLLRVSGADKRAERTWYDSRAAAESIKSLTWQYAVCGEIFRKSDTDASGRFTHELKTILKELKELDIPAGESTASAITGEMAELRSLPLPHRMAIYKRHRIEDQLAWYRRKAEWNRKRARRWRRGMIAVEALAVLLGLARALSWFDVDWLSILAALAAVVAAWQQTKNYLGLSQSYSVTSHDVTLVGVSIDRVETEEEWSQAVHDAEAAFSREHTLWRARRQGPLSS